MKKTFLISMITVFMLTFVLSGCFLFNAPQETINGGIVSAQITKEGVEFTSNVDAQGVEVTINLKGISRENVLFEKDELGIVTNEATFTKITVAKIGKASFVKGEKLFVIRKSLSSLNGIIIGGNHKSLLTSSAMDIDTNYPIGLSINALHMSVNSEGTVTIHAKGISNVEKIRLVVNYDPNYLNVDTSVGNKGVSLLSPLNSGIAVVKSSTPGVIDISISLANPINILDSDIVEIALKSLNNSGETEVGFGNGTEIEDSDDNPINIDKINGYVKINMLKLLGDFDENGKVNLRDFMMFAQHFGTKKGEKGYKTLYDIAPASKVGGYNIWDVAYPDGVIGFKDFKVFLQNYSKTAPIPADAPSNLRVTDYSTDTITLTWQDNSDNESGFEVWRSKDGINFNEVKAVKTNVTSYKDIGLTPNTIYYYKVRAYNDFGYSSYTNIATQETMQVIPNPPSNLSVASYSSTQITLQWDDDNNDWQYFAVARSETQDFSSYTVVGTTTQKTFEDTTVASGSTYYYLIAAVNQAGYSTSNVVKAYAIDNSEVTIPDAGLRQAILDALGKSSTPIYRSDLMSLTGLNASGRSITNLEGIQYCTNLQWLDLSNNNITDISKLASLTNLEYIGIQGNHNLSDISPLRYLTSLTSINMYGDNISDISALA
ncbi:leucine-rich repeat domain-containing protein, partial [Mesoaciditoga lauensis]|uniref:leucine-rich repeat domain-containing protein n=1 Tax=Mesoaciditoga lauensis TaxID=1495039 RepID=UPI001B80C60D